MNVEVELVYRECEICRAPFRCLDKSEQVVCSTACKDTGTPALGARKKGSLVNVNKTHIVSVSVGPPTRPSEPLNAFIAKICQTGGRRKKEKDTEKGQEETMRSTNITETKRELNGAGKINHASSTINGHGTQEIRNDIRPKNVPAVIVGTQPELSEDFHKSLSQEGLTSIQLLRKSSNRLMRLMEECVHDSDLDKSADGTQRVESHRIQTAINCADSLTNVVNTQVQLLKVLKDFGGK